MMRFKVTCTTCGKPFGVESMPGQEVRCVCPFCGREMVVSLPRVDTARLPEQVSSSARLSEQERLPKDEGSTSGCLKTLAVVLFLLIVIGAIGAYLYIDYTQQRLEKVERAEKEANRKAHQEELLRERELQRQQWVETPATPQPDDVDDNDDVDDEIIQKHNENHITYETDQDSV